MWAKSWTHLNTQWRNWRRAQVDLKRFQALPQQARQWVFYAEDAGSWVHFEAIIEQLTGTYGRKLCYLTSSAQDPILNAALPGVDAFYIGLGSLRTLCFSTLRAGIMVMTLPDLNTFHIRRSQAYPVHYVYVFHSMVSTHMIYRPAAFDAFDTIFCVGPHHVNEIRAWEQARGLPTKQLVQHGYGRLDALLKTRQAAHTPKVPAHVLVAPSWGPQGLLERYAGALIATLLQAGFEVTLRPHPVTLKTHAKALHAALQPYANHERLHWDTDMASQASLQRSQIMISDWSGAALEYAFGLEKPVVFVDMPRKINNPDYAQIACAPLELSLRSVIGSVVAAEDLAALPRHIEQLLQQPQAQLQSIRQAREHNIFNVGHSGRAGAEALLALEQQLGTLQPTHGSQQHAYR